MLKIFTPFNESLKSNQWQYVHVNKTESFEYRLVFYCNFASAHYFYENTSFKWYLRTTYDCYIHLPNLYRYIQKLNTKYDGYKDIVMKGDHCRYFIHGGPGWIMSRAAVKEYLRMEDEMTNQFNRNSQGDDVNIILFPQKFNLTYNDIHAPEFAGWPVTDSSYQQLINSNFSYSNFTDFCQRYLNPSKVNSLVIWHNGRRKDYVNTIGKKIIEEAPDYLGLHFHEHVGGYFCRFKEKAEPKPKPKRKIKKIIVKRRRKRH